MVSKALIEEELKKKEEEEEATFPPYGCQNGFLRPVMFFESDSNLLNR